MPLVRASLVIVLWLSGLLGNETLARGDDLLPGLETADLREKSREELKKLAPKSTGLYLAFDPSATDPIASAACDDDGDPVIVLSDAMLRLARDVAHASAAGDEKVTSYAAFLARSQKIGKRVLPPPAGFYGDVVEDDDRLRDVLSFLVAREVVHHESGDLTCANPTATKESGDDTWTDAEQKAARATAAKLYPGSKAAARDGQALERTVRAGRSREGARALLRFFGTLEGGAWTPTYLVDHPKSQTRLTSIVSSAP